MLAPAENAVTITTWLADFESALAESDEILLGTLFHRDSHWRDVLALTWSFKTINGRDAIVNEFCKLDRGPADELQARYESSPAAIRESGRSSFA